MSGKQTPTQGRSCRKIRGRRSRIFAPAVLLLVSAALLAGCQGAIQGRWHLEEAVPNKQTFALDHVSFNADGTYAATTTFEGVTRQETGEYEFNGFNLRLRPQGGGQRKYTAQLGPGQLMLLDGSRKVVLRSGARGV
jgi:hypothetical protein